MVNQKKLRGKEATKSLVVVTVGVAILLVFMGVYLNYRASVGKAVYIEETPWTGGTIDLTHEGSLTITVLPVISQQFVIRTGTSLYDDPLSITDDPQDYLFTLTNRGLQLYGYSLTQQGEVIPRAADILYVGGAEDHSSLYLNNDDAVPDLAISYAEGQITVENLHYISPDQARISLYALQEGEAEGETASPNPFVPIIRLAPEAMFQARVNASSSFPPQLEAEILPSILPQPVLAVPVENREQNFTMADLSWQAPLAPGAAVLDITAMVQGQETHAYYTLAVGDVVYALPEIPDTFFPSMTMQLVDAATAEVTVVLRPTMELQPFALPCSLGESLDSFLQETGVSQVYSYGGTPAAPQVWNRVGGRDFTSLVPLRGYFMALSDELMNEPEQRTLQFQCSVQSIVPSMAALVPPSASAQTFSFSTGWTLFALPGTIPRMLMDFNPTREDFRIFEYTASGTWQEVSRTVRLIPGRPYWIFTSVPMSINYRIVSGTG